MGQRCWWRGRGLRESWMESYTATWWSTARLPHSRSVWDEFAHSKTQREAVMVWWTLFIKSTDMTDKEETSSLLDTDRLPLFCWQFVVDTGLDTELSINLSTPLSNVTFRVCAYTGAGQGPWTPTQTLTLIAPGEWQGSVRAANEHINDNILHLL